MARIKSGFLGERAVILPAAILDEYQSDTMGCLLHVTDIGFYPKANYHYRKRSAGETSQYILIYCTEGEGWFELEGRTTSVSANQVFILPKGKAHRYGSNPAKAWTIYWIHFDGQLAARLAEGFEKPFTVLPGNDSRIEERLRLFEDLFSTLRNGYSKNNLEFSSITFLYFLGTFRYLSAYRNSHSPEQPAQHRNRTEEAIHFMRENVRKRLHLDEMAAFVGYSPSHFSTLFHEETGFAPVHYFLQLKIQEACHFLDFTEMKVHQISSMMGFDDPFYFSRMFTKTMGDSPSAYRKRKKG